MRRFLSIGVLVAAFVATSFLAYADFTYNQSLKSGPYAHFQRLNPELSEKEVFEVGNKEIVQISLANMNIDQIRQKIVSLGFTEKIFTGDDLRKRMNNPDTIVEYLYSYRYGYFSITHAWVFSFDVDKNNEIDPSNSFQVCVKCL